MLWVQADSYGEGGSSRIISKSNTGQTNGAWLLRIGGRGAIQFAKDYQTNDLQRSSNHAVLRTDGTWQHVAITWTGSVGFTSVRIYSDGQEVLYGVLSGNATGNYISDTSMALVLGNQNDATRTFDGRIAHAHLFRQVLTGDQIRQVMSFPASVLPLGVAGASTAGLIGYWPMYGLSANEPDLSGNGFTGVVTSAPFDRREPPVNAPFVMAAPAMHGGIGG